VTESAPPQGRILVVDEWLPTPDRDSGSLRMHRLLSVLRSLDWHVTFAARTPTLDGDRLLSSQGVAVVPREVSIDRHLRLAGRHYEAVLLSRPDVAAAYLADVRRHVPQAMLLYDSPDLYFVREYRQARLLGSRPHLEQALAHKRQELGLVRAADRTLVVSAAEKEVLHAECDEAVVHVVSNIHASEGSQRSFYDRQDVLFVGNFGHEPNVDAGRHLLEEVWPRARRTLGDARLFVVGPNPPDEFRERLDEHVVVTGHVPDVSPYLDTCRVSVAPLRFGAGVKGKVLESLGRGQPVVGSSIAFEGLPVETERDVLLADDPAATAAGIVRLYEDRALWERLSRAGPKIVAADFSFAAARRALAEALPPAGIESLGGVAGGV